MSLDNASQPLVEMSNIEKHFGGIRAVNGVSLDLYPGEVVGVLGHNGAGKSCLMRILSGAMIANEGELLSKEGIPKPVVSNKDGMIVAATVKVSVVFAAARR